MKYEQFNSKISFKRLNCDIEPGVSISCYGYEDFTERKSNNRMHKMSDYTLQFIEFGEGTLNINGAVYIVKQHDLFFLPYNEPLMYYHNPRNPYKYYWISIRGDKFMSFLEKTQLSIQNPVISIEDHEKMLKLFKDLNPNENISTIKIKASFYSILDMIEKKNVSKRTSIDNTSLFSQIIEFIKLNYSQADLSIGFIAEQFYISTVELYRLFMANANCSAKEYLIKYRIKKAKEFISKNVSISNTSNICGYADLYYFSRAFKKHTGMTPTQYKNSLKTQD